MSQAKDDATEQLSAWMDGELPDAEARFLQRRLEHDETLRAAWMRMQLASQCLRGQDWQPMDEGFAARVAAGVTGAGRSTGPRRPMRWAIAASVAALALLIGPRLLQQAPVPAPTIAEVPAPMTEQIVASPASADLVAMRAPEPQAAAVAAADTAADTVGDRPLVASAPPSDRASPLPLATRAPESPSEFPLLDTGEERSWPRSELAGASSDPAIEAYLVRHNQMLAEDGLGGFVPYVDVVANGRPATSSEAAEPDEADKQ